MKRSKMLEEIQQLVRDSYIIEESTLRQAQKILSKIEKLGMRPPLRRNPKYLDLTEMQYYDKVTVAKYYNQDDLEPYYLEDWEPEDENL